VRIVLERRYGAAPASIPHPPDLEAMLRVADAAVIIGDSALRIDPARLPYYVYDLGGEWVEMTGLPMVFAVWAGRKGVVTAEVAEAFRESCRYGRARMDEIVASEAPRRGFPPDFVEEYLTRRIVNELGPREYQGMDLFLSYARQLRPSGGSSSLPRSNTPV
jgi:predicted solute-binding protein